MAAAVADSPSSLAVMAAITSGQTRTLYPLFTRSKSNTKGDKARPLRAASCGVLRDGPAMCGGFDLTTGFWCYFPPLDDALFLSTISLCYCIL